MSTAVDPTLNEAADVLFTPEEKQKLKDNLITEQIKQAKYLREHPEIERTMRRAIAELVKAKPDDAVGFLTSYFVDNDLEEVEITEAAKWLEAQQTSNSHREPDETDQ